MAKQLLRLTAEMILERTQDDIAWVPIEKLSQFQENYSAVSTANGAHSSLTAGQMHPSVQKLQDHARRQHHLQLAKGQSMHRTVQALLLVCQRPHWNLRCMLGLFANTSHFHRTIMLSNQRLRKKMKVNRPTAQLNECKL